MKTKKDFELLGHIYAIPYPDDIEKIDRFMVRVAGLKGVNSIREPMHALNFLLLEIDIDGIKSDVLEKVARLYKIYD